MQKIKLIWDFRGPDSEKMAEHHQVHLDEFVKRENLSIQDTGFEKIDDSYSLAYLVVEQEDMIPVRDALLPHRGERV